MSETERFLTPVGEYDCRGCGAKIGEKVQIGDDGPVGLRIGGSATLWLEVHSGICLHCGETIQYSAGTVRMAKWLSRAAGRLVRTEELEEEHDTNPGQ